MRHPLRRRLHGVGEPRVHQRLEGGRTRADDGDVDFNGAPHGDRGHAVGGVGEVHDVFQVDDADNRDETDPREPSEVDRSVGERGHSTHKKPTPNRAMTLIFWFLAILNDKTAGMGSAKMAKSVTICRREFSNPTS